MSIFQTIADLFRRLFRIKRRPRLTVDSPFDSPEPVAGWFPHRHAAGRIGPRLRCLSCGSYVVTPGHRPRCANCGSYSYKARGKS